MNCPKCHRPINEGNSPNVQECHETDDDEGVCSAYAQIAIMREALDDIATTAHCIAKAGPSNTPTLQDAWTKFMGLEMKAREAMYKVRHL